jgi:hypothetical protein
MVGGSLIFGLLTFLLGLVVGINVTPPPATQTAALAASPAPVQAGAVQAGAVQAGAASSAGGASGKTAASQPEPAKPEPQAPAPSSTPTPAEPPLKPVKVKGFSFGPPASNEPVSALRGALLRDASAPPVPSPSTSAPAAPAEKAPAGAPAVYSVAVGRFLVERNASQLLTTARAKGFRPMVVVPDDADDTPWLVVTLGPASDATAAGRLAVDASAQGFDAQVVSWLPP